MKALPLVGLILVLAVSLAAAPSGPAWRMKADYVEACSCHLFCPCYFNKHAEHPMCEFNMAVTVREGHSGDVNLASAKYWLTGDLGDKWGTEKKGSWVTVPMAAMKLKREPGADGKGVVLKNLKYFGASQNDGFQLYKSIEHRADVNGHQFTYSDRNAFLITIVSEELKEK